MLAGTAWYLMLTLDLFVALVNPWMGYSCKAWAYHIMYVCLMLIHCHSEAHSWL